MEPQNTTAAGTVTLERVSTPPAQTWNRLRANDVTLVVPVRERTGSVRSSLPRLFDSVECGMGRAVTDWVASQTDDSRYVEVPARTVREEPVVVRTDASAGDVRDTGVMVREGASCTIVVAAGAGEKRASDNASDSAADAALPTSASLLRVVAEAGAHVRIVEVLGIAEGQQHLESVGISAQGDARVEVCQYVLGGSATALGLACDLAGDRARIDLSCRYHADHDHLVDVNHVVRQRGRGTRAEVRESGILDDEARKTLRATIDLVHGAKGAKGNEAESVLVLGDGVVNKTVPVILCDEDDVAGNHGATIGSVSPEQISYLENRGLSRDQAESLFVRALFEDAIMHAADASARAVACAACERVLGAEAAGDLAEAGLVADGEALA